MNSVYCLLGGLLTFSPLVGLFIFLIYTAGLVPVLAIFSLLAGVVSIICLGLTLLEKGGCL